jgi:hypothetical protein
MTTQGQVAIGTAGTAYSFMFVGTGSGTLTWSATGLPADGLSLNANTGTVSGTPAAKAAIAFTLTLSDTFGQSSAATPFTITVNNPPAPTIMTTQGQVAIGTAGTAYSFTFHGTGSGTLTWSATGLPADGLSLSSSTGVVSGTPTAKAAVAFTLTLSDTFGQSSAATPFTITVNNPPAPTIMTTQGQVAIGTAGTPYTFTFVGNGSGTLTWSATGLPADGLSLNSSTGVVSGTPAAKAAIAFTLTLSDTFGQSSAATPFTITVNNPLAPTITTTQNQVPSAVVNVAYSFTFLAKGSGTLTWSVSPPLTDNLSLNTATGAITGTPNAAATVSFNLTVTDSFGQSSVATPFTITVSTTTIVFTQAPPSSVAAGSTAVNVSATVTNDPGNGGVDWTLSCGGGDCGSITAHTTSGGQASWTPPTTVPPSGSVTITAAVHDFPSVTVAATVTINPPVIVIVFTQAPPSSLVVSTTANVSSTVSNDPSNAGVDWTVTCGSAGACGSFNPTHTPSGTQTVYTAPSSVPTGSTVTITAASTADSTKNVMATVTITSSVALTCPLPKGGNEALMNGNTYAARFTGWDDTKGPFNAVASFTAGLNGDGTGNIAAGGVVDSNGTGANQTNPDQGITGGCYSVGADFRGTMIWTFSGGDSVAFAISVRSDGHKGKMIEFDDPNPNPPTSGKSRGSGEFRKQDTTAFSASTLSGAFAFGIIGWTPGSGGGISREGVIGVLTFDGISMITSGAADFSAKGTSLANLGVTGSFTAPDTTHGRGTMTLMITGSPLGTITETFAYYIEKTGQLFIQTTNMPDAMGGHIAANGVAIKQSGGPFGMGSFNAPAVFSVTGFDVSHNGTNTAVGMITSTGNGTFTGVLDDNSDAPQLDAAITGNITMSPNGLGVATVTNLGPDFNPIAVAMVQPNAGFLLEGTPAQPGNDVSAGALLPQTVPAGGFTAGSISGALFFGSDEPATTGVNVQSGVVTFANPNLTVTSDKSGLGGLVSGQVQTQAYTMTVIGRGVIGSGGSPTVLWLISPSKALVMDGSQQGGTGNTTIINVEQ